MNWQSLLLSSNKMTHYFNPIQHGIFGGCSQMGRRANRPHIPKVCHTFPTMIKLGTLTPYPKKIQKIYESRDTLLEFC